MIRLPSEGGSYIVIGWLDSDRQFTSGPFLNEPISAGYYLYFGSALGSGGLKARIGRHLNPNTTRFWHFDHLKNKLELMEIWFSISPINLECEFVKVLQDRKYISFPFKKFGSSDCYKGCPAHLARINDISDLNAAFIHLKNFGLNLLSLVLN